jgi:hypothetical protein
MSDNNETSFEDQLIQIVKNKIKEELKKGEYTRVDYQQRKVVPLSLIEKAWALVNWDEVLVSVREDMQVRICNAMVGAMEAEIKTDVKALMSISGVREKLRVNVYPSLMATLNNKD